MSARETMRRYAPLRGLGYAGSRSRIERMGGALWRQQQHCVGIRGCPELRSGYVAVRERDIAVR